MVMLPDIIPTTDLISGSYPSNHKLWWCQTQPHCNLTNLPSISRQAERERKNRAHSLSTHDKDQRGWWEGYKLIQRQKRWRVFRSAHWCTRSVSQRAIITIAKMRSGGWWEMDKIIQTLNISLNNPAVKTNSVPYKTSCWAKINTFGSQKKQHYQIHQISIRCREIVLKGVSTHWRQNESKRERHQREQFRERS